MTTLIFYHDLARHAAFAVPAYNLAVARVLRLHAASTHAQSRCLATAIPGGSRSAKSGQSREKSPARPLPIVETVAPAAVVSRAVHGP